MPRGAQICSRSCSASRKPLLEKEASSSQPDTGVLQGERVYGSGIPMHQPGHLLVTSCCSTPACLCHVDLGGKFGHGPRGIPPAQHPKGSGWGMSELP